MYSRLVPQLVFPAYERLSGRRFWTEVEQLRSRQWATPAEVEARVVERLRTLLAHAAAHVPHYREVFGAAGLDVRAIRTVDDLARVPITTKADLRRRFPDGVSAENLPARRRMRGVTSGSTGQPLEFYLDRAAADTWTGAYLFFLEWAGTAFWHTEIVIASPRHFYLAGRHVGPAAASRPPVAARPGAGLARRSGHDAGDAQVRDRPLGAVPAVPSLGVCVLRGPARPRAAGGGKHAGERPARRHRLGRNAAATRA